MRNTHKPMGKMIYVLTRFYVPGPMYYHAKKINSKTNIVNDPQFGQMPYSDWLYHEERIKQRLKIFNAVTRVSMELQTYKNFAWILFTGKGMPKKYIDEIASIPRCVIIPVDRREDIIKKRFILNSEFITVRLDDDDALHATYLEKIQHFNTPKCIVAPMQGRYFTLMDEHTVQTGLPRSNDAINCLYSAGCGVSNRNIYKLGGHCTYAEQGYDRQLIPGENMFLQSAGAHTWSDRTIDASANLQTFNIRDVLTQ